MIANDLEYRILANSILSQVYTLFTRLQSIVQILYRETLPNRIRVSLRKEKRGIKKVFTTLPISNSELQWQIMSYGYSSTVDYLYSSLSFLITRIIDKQEILNIVKDSDAIRASIPIFSNAVFDPQDILKSMRNIKRAIRLVLIMDHTDLKNTNILIQWVAQESRKVFGYFLYKK